MFAQVNASVSVPFGARPVTNTNSSVYMPIGSRPRSDGTATRATPGVANSSR
jgi:hypothetical protein